MCTLKSCNYTNIAQQMEYTNYTARGRNKPASQLPRSKSGTHAAMSSPYKIYPCNTSLTSTQRLNNNNNNTTARSKSTTKSRITSTTSTSNYGVNKFLQRGGGTSPRSKGSAWALSPGRSGSSVVAPEGAGKARTAVSGGAMSGVFNYFRQKKKVNSAQEEEFHSYRIANNRLVQWRFVNAAAAASMAARTRLAQERLFCVWIVIWKMRSSIVEKRKMAEKVKQEIKVYQILNPQIRLLSEWAKLEKKNCEAVGRVARKLCGISVRLPLDDDAKAEEESVIKAIKEAEDVMGGIEQVVVKQFLYQQVEKLLYTLTELTITIKQQEECMEELEKHIPLLATSVIKEATLRAHLLQVTTTGIKTFEYS